jgi:cell division septation protein DedD
MKKRLATLMLAGLAAFACPPPALADVKDGVDAWSSGDWDAAIAEWRAPAQAGDPDAQFNMGQAYRLGRGVPQDQALAESYYLSAAQNGHLRAADTYGLLLFQDGRREQALPYIEGAAERGDPRAQYLLGIAHFNGDIVAKDWVRAYALLTLANGQGLPQAAPALAEMDKNISLGQRQQAASLAVTMQQEADATRAREMAAADLAMAATDRARAQAQSVASAGSSPTPQPFLPVPRTAAPTPIAPAPVQQASPRVAQPVAGPEPEPAVLAARQAVREAMIATGTEDPGTAGADYARPAAAPQVTQFTLERASQPVRPSPPQAAAAPPAVSPAQRPARAEGVWKVQLGAFSVRGNAERLWAALQNRPELAGRNPLLVPSGRLTKLQVGGFATRGEAQSACASLERSGQACLVTQ